MDLRGVLERMKRRDWIELRREPERDASRTLAALCPGEPPARPITAAGRRPGLLARSPASFQLPAVGIRDLAQQLHCGQARRGDRAGRRPLRSGVGARLRHRDRASRSRSSCARTGGGAHRSTRIRAARLDDRHQSPPVRGGPGRCDRDRHAAVAAGRHHPATCCCAGPWEPRSRFRRARVDLTQTAADGEKTPHPVPSRILTTSRIRRQN